MRLYYDFHIHTTRSQCADEDMTPQNVINMAVLKELDVIAITDHNTTKACRECIEFAKDYQILVIPGMELMTAEDIHVLCLFENIDGAENFEKLVKTDFKAIIDEFSAMRIDDVKKYVAQFGGIAVPAHVTRQSNSILGILGDIDESLDFTTIEITNNRVTLEERFLSRFKIIVDSDAHDLGSISERDNFLEVNECSAKDIIAHLYKPKE